MGQKATDLEKCWSININRKYDFITYRKIIIKEMSFKLITSSSLIENQDQNQHQILDLGILDRGEKKGKRQGEGRKRYLVNYQPILILSTSIFISIFFYLSILIYIYPYLYLSLYLYLSASSYPYLHLYLSISIFIHLSILIYIYSYLYLPLSLSIYIYIFI